MTKPTPTQELIRKAVVNAALDPRLAIHRLAIDDLCAIADTLEQLMALHGYKFFREHATKVKYELELESGHEQQH